MDDEDTVELLRKVSFYKVSHHASHNGTPRDFVNNIVGKDCWEPLIAMSSVTPHGGYEDIPHRQLMDALESRFDHIAISDVTGSQAGFSRATKWSIDFEFDPDPAPVD